VIAKHVDLTSKIADLGMYSYARPAYTFWNGFANALLSAGYEESAVLEVLRSKFARWELDKDDSLIEKLGCKMGAEFIRTNRAAVDEMLDEIARDARRGA